MKRDELCLRVRLGFEISHLPAVALLANLFHKYQPLSQGDASVAGEARDEHTGTLYCPVQMLSNIGSYCVINSSDVL